MIYGNLWYVRWRARVIYFQIKVKENVGRGGVLHCLGERSVKCSLQGMFQWHLSQHNCDVTSWEPPCQLETRNSFSTKAKRITNKVTEFITLLHLLWRMWGFEARWSIWSPATHCPVVVILLTSVSPMTQNGCFCWAKYWNFFPLHLG